MKWVVGAMDLVDNLRFGGQKWDFNRHSNFSGQNPIFSRQNLEFSGHYHEFSGQNGEFSRQNQHFSRHSIFGKPNFTI